MFEAIKKCNKCSLCKYQEPLIEEANDCSVIWVGLSAKIATYEGEGPLSPKTNSGELLHNVEGKCPNVPMYRTNLVKCVPLNEEGKLRYPNRKEIDVCLPHLKNEIDELAPQIIFLLGGKVIDAVSHYFSVEFEKWDKFNYSFSKYHDMYFVPVHHPSYVYVYKHKMIDEYVNGLVNVIRQLL